MSPRSRWAFAIVGLLAANALAMVILVAFASDGETQVIPAYYEKAVHYDDALDQARASRALGWHAEVAFARGGVEVALRDARGAAIDGARVTVTGYQRARASRALAIELSALGDGRYRAQARGPRGVHDLTICVEHGGARFTQHAVIEAP